MQCSTRPALHHTHPHPHPPPPPPQFFRLGKLAARDPAEAYQLDTRLRLGVGVRASGVGGKTLQAGARRCCRCRHRGLTLAGRFFARRAVPSLC